MYMPKYMRIGLHVCVCLKGVNLCVRRVKSNCIKRSFSYRIPKDWNELPMDIKSAKSLAVFKNKLWFYLLK